MTIGPGPLLPEHDVVVTAAAGGTGKLVVQMAKHAGARVLGLVSTERKAEIASDYGCDDVFIYRRGMLSHIQRHPGNGKQTRWRVRAYLSPPVG